ncbi:hypothetical protein GTQ40_05835 [Flavobacteriaceae bacterium R38]|nr:hypothetical protein [Flavobacteriaceae bacterium R38]
MQFKHPEILWALLLLIIPILIHLFQLRRFQKVAFTNVKFLKEVTIQTRKSSELKKWLVLLSRMLAIASAVIAFAQPYFANRNILTTSKETVIYLDNSFSMQLKGEKGPLLNRAIQELISGIPEDEEVTVFTNDFNFSKNTIKSIQNQLLQLPYTAKQLNLSEIILKGQNSFQKNTNSLKNLVIISDFQQNENNQSINSDSLIQIEAVKLNPVSTNNLSLDSVYISKTTPSNIELAVKVSMANGVTGSHPISFFNDDKLIAKVAAEFNQSREAIVNFSFPSDNVVNGRLSIEDSGLQYDNTIYFNINTPEKINVLTINEAESIFLNRIFTQDEFNLTNYNYNELDYSVIEQQNLIVLNELKNIPNSLSTALNSFHQNGGKIIVIPSEESNNLAYNQFLRSFSVNVLDTISPIEKKITKINFSHPVYQDVFDKEINNFQYPKVSKNLIFDRNHPSLLDYEDGTSFLFEENGVYIFSASLNENISNFKNSPLIVPTLYSIAKKSLQLPKLYYRLGDENQVDIKVSINQDAILNVSNEVSQFIPLQQSFPNKVALNFIENPKESGIYSVKNEGLDLQKISFNYPRYESNLNYSDPGELGINTVSNSVSLFFDQLKKDGHISELWKWFVTFALIFLIIEILLLKFLN